MADADEVDRIYSEALRRSAADRAAFLARECPDDAVRQEVDSMLRAAGDADAQGFLKTGLLQRPAAPPEVKEPAPSSIGPYRLIRALGKGGMGVVHEAEHEATLQRVAIKTVRVPASSELTGLRREIHALARIRHPGIVRILDEGVASGVPWYAMELVSGMSLWGLRWRAAPQAVESLHAATTPIPGRGTEEDPTSPTLQVAAGAAAAPAAAGAPGPAPEATALAGTMDEATLVRILTTTRRLCAPLAYLHGEGLVHRDLKPDNVIVRDDGTPVIVDFGLTAHFGGPLAREQLQTKGDVSGTIAYMSPEQGRGDIVDARSDLYALGCILYELCTDRPPFVGTTVFEVLAKHASQEPEPPSRLVGGVPPALDALILRLLEKEPARRPGHADDVAAWLLELGAEAGAPAGPAPRAYLYRPGFSGRASLVATLGERLTRLTAGTGGAVLMSGESGTGKTRLMVELAGMAVERGVHVLTGECLPRSGGTESTRAASEGLQALRRPLQHVADECRERGKDFTDRVLGPRGRVLVHYEPALAELPGQDAYPPPDELPPEEARLRVWSYLAETLGAFSATFPPRGRTGGGLLLLLDDLQWADDLTAGLLTYLLRGRQLEAMNVLLVGGYRSEEAAHVPVEVRECASAERFTLGRLDDADVGSMIADMLAMPAPPGAFASFLARQSEGNPFFIAEYLRTAVQEGVLFRDGEGRWRMAAEGERELEADFESLPLPGSVRDLVARRLDGLSESARELCAGASVLGREARESLVRAVWGGSDEQGFMEASEQLIARQVLAEERAGVLRFVHDKIREVAYERLAPARRASLHRASAMAIESVEGGGLVDEQLADLGRHWDLAGEAERARRYYLPAARRAAGRYAHDEARRLYRSFLALGAGAAADVEAMTELAERVLAPMGRTAEALEAFGDAARGGRGLGERQLEASALRGALRMLKMTGRHEEARSAGEGALAIARELGDRVLEGRLHSELAALDIEVGMLEAGAARCEEALAMARATGDLQTETTTLVNLGILSYRLGRSTEARRLCEQALQRARERGDRPSEVKTQNHVATFLYYQGELARARELYVAALGGAHEIGDVRLQALVRGNMACLLDVEGRVDEATREYQEAVRVQRRIGDLRMAAGNLNNLGALFHLRGRLPEAMEQYRDAIALARELGDRRMEGQFLTNLGQATLDAGSSPEARALLDDALALLRATGDRAFESHALGHLATMAMDEARLEEAEELLSSALAIRRDVEERAMEGATLVALARLHRLRGELARAVERLEGASVLLAAAGDKIELARCHVEQAHLALARGEDARTLVRDAQVEARQLQASPASALGRAVQSLVRARSAASTAGRVVRGELLEDAPPPLRRYLESSASSS